MTVRPRNLLYYLLVAFNLPLAGSGCGSSQSSVPEPTPFATVAHEAAVATRPSLFVLEEFHPSSRGEISMEALSSAVVAELDRHPEYSVVGIDDIDSLAAADMVSGCSKPECFVAAAEELTAERILSLQILKVDTEWAVTSQLIDSRTTRILVVMRMRVEGDQAMLIKAIPSLIRATVKAPPNQEQ